MDLYLWIVAALALGLAAYLLVTRQFKWLWRIARNAALGVAAILLINLALHGVGLAVGINSVTTLTVGVLGLPGLLLLYTTQVLVR